eukprot:CAMPEP_0177650486 /NCGR_PEP_ID=MMETSP0447-20121125/11969_1 /TAXON_ID=0 /ORGANISM="Stygamoeba regulata, Strain BSH-02190019" /LENGTH=233 /DNA_ID=CAMNT_0019153361 /DNA_START=178 /DNA_END=876 /DNA_ORIENTATION=-
MYKLCSFLLLCALLQCAAADPKPPYNCTGWVSDDQALYLSPDWEVAGKSDNITLLKHKMPSHSDIPIFRYDLTFDLTHRSDPMKFFKWLYTLDSPGYMSYSPNWVPQLSYGVDLPVDSDGGNHNYGVYNFPWPLSDRDCCQYNCPLHTSSDGKFNQATGRTVDMGSCASVAKKDIDVHLFEVVSKFWRFSDDGRTLHYTFFNQEVPGGNIPGWFVSKFYPSAFLKEAKDFMEW